MSAFPIGVMLDSFRKPWTEALDIACELGASGIQAHGGHGLLAVKTVTPAVKKEFMAQMREEHNGIDSVKVRRAVVDSTGRGASVFLMLHYGDKSVEQVIVPLVKRDSVWLIR